MKILNQENNILLNRKELNMIIEHSGIAPKKESIISEIAEQFKTEGSLIVVKGIYPRYGSYELNIIAYIYESLGHLNKIEGIKEKKTKKDGEKKGKKQATK